LKGITFVAITLLFGLAEAHAEVKTSFTPRMSLSAPPKGAPGDVEVFEAASPPDRPHIVLGALTVASDGTQSSDELDTVARSKAAEMGADFVMFIGSTNDTKIKTNPSYSFAIPLLRLPMMLGGTGGMETKVEKIPTRVFVVGLYTKATLGILWDQELAKKQSKYVVEDFRSYSRAQQAGVRIGDNVLEINGLRMTDPRLVKLFAVTQPETVMTLLVKRGDERINLEVPAVETR